jgi:hypothetical protein
MTPEHKLKGLGMLTFLIFCALVIALSHPTVPTSKFHVKYWFDKKLDDTDNLETGDRSGFALYVDHGTGVHYIKTPFGSLTPRINQDGKVVSEYQQEQIRKKTK